MKKGEPKWIVIQVCRSAQQAEQIRARLSEEGFLIRVAPLTELGEDALYQIMCLPSEAREARASIIQMGV